jgi:aminoglycoside phosphotransferase (APT) family kinase protein
VPGAADLVHGDLLHANVLVTEDASRPNAVFSWKNSARGDFLYDTAWCTFCAFWYPGIEAIDLWARVRQEPLLHDESGAWTDASLRHHFYELYIGTTALAYNTWTGDAQLQADVVGRLSEILERGPLPDAT